MKKPFAEWKRDFSAALKAGDPAAYDAYVSAYYNRPLRKTWRKWLLALIARVFG